MIDLICLKTGLDVEKEINEIISSAINYSISHVEASKEIDKLFEYGKETGKFSKSEIADYMRRKNRHGNGRARTHLEFALNLFGGQKEEHKVFLHLVEWLKKNKTEEIKWELHGSDYKGYLMIVDCKNKKKVIEPDYRLYIGEKQALVEAKSFNTPPTFKVANLKKYKKRKACIAIQYRGRYYFCKTSAINHMLRQEISYKWGQDVIQIDQNYINQLIEKEFIRDMTVC